MTVPLPSVGMSLTVARRYRGPQDSGNGGYVSGLVAGALGLDAATVTLRVPPPLGVALEVSSGATPKGGARLVDGDTTVAEIAPADANELAEVPPLTASEARAAESSYAGLKVHPFPECFVCGPQRERPDGMRLLPGRLRNGRTACVWPVTADLADRPEFVWAALDCPGGWSAPIEGRPMVLGRMTAQVTDLPVAGEECVVMGLLDGAEGRKTFTSSTVYGADGRRLGSARATWIAITAG